MEKHSLPTTKELKNGTYPYIPLSIEPCPVFFLANFLP